MDKSLPEIFTKFTTHLKQALIAAENVSRRYKHDCVDIEHILYGILLQKGSAASNILRGKKITPEIFKKIFGKLPIREHWRETSSPKLKIIFKKAIGLASRYHYKYIGTEHVLYVILNLPDSKSEKIFKELGVDIPETKKHLEALFESNSHFPDLERMLDFVVKPQKDFLKEQQENNLPKESKTSALDYFCIDLVRQAEEGLLDAVIGRDEEIRNLTNVLGRKIKNNPILIGDAGVGKTAVVQGLAQRIAAGYVPETLAAKKIYSLDLGLLVAGTVFRGEFEGRLKDILFEIQEMPEAILFIDEIHTIIGAGSASGSLDAANILKPALSRGEIQCIGATTSDEYHRYFRKDPALKRRFQPILIKEPNQQETFKILSGLRQVYEKYHNLKITDQAIASAVRLSERFITDRFQPDKAIDLLDEAASLVKNREKRINYFKEIRRRSKEKQEIAFEKEKAVSREAYEEAMDLKEKEETLGREIESLKKRQEAQFNRGPKRIVKEEDIGQVVANLTGIPIAQLITSEAKRLNNLENILASEIIGQDEAIFALASTIRRARANIASPQRPQGSFIFLGPTGVGKTELARVLAKKVYSDKEAFIKIDMSEFMEPNSVSRLIGASPGYVGYEEGGKLTEKIRLHPYSVVLFDEIEKAHPDIFNILLQILEDGELTDATGRKINFKNTIIIMTSNIGTDDFTQEALIGFNLKEKKQRTDSKKIKERYQKIKSKTIEKLKEIFRPELLNRIDKVVVFNPLDLTAIRKITRLQLNFLRERLAEQKIKISPTPRLVRFIAQRSFDPNQGARLIRRNIENLIENPLAEKIISGEFKKENLIRVDVENKKIILRRIDKRNEMEFVITANE